jgi:DNA-binding FadR family transcriptional regulator
MRTSLGRNLTHGLVDAIGRAIVTGSYEKRPFPIEAELEKKHGVSRSVTREAVKMLTAKGLLSARPRQGTVVLPRSSWNLFDTDVLRWLLERKFSIELLRQFAELRLAIEPAGAALAAARADTAGLQAITRGIRRMERAAQDEDDTLESDIEFHIAILQATGNPFFAQFRDVVTTALHTSIRFTNRMPGLHTADLPAHRAVYMAIIKREPARARAAMEKLLGDPRAIIDRALVGKARSGKARSGKVQAGEVQASRSRKNVRL